MAARRVAPWPGLPGICVPSGRLPGLSPGAGQSWTGGRAGGQRRGRAGSDRPVVGARPAGAARRRAGCLCADPAAGGRIPACPVRRPGGQVAAARCVVMGIRGVYGVLRDDGTAAAGNSGAADGTVRAAAGHGRVGRAAAHGLGAGAAGSSREPGRSGRAAGGAAGGPAQFPGAVCRRPHARGAGRRHPDSGRIRLRRPGCGFRPGRRFSGQGCGAVQRGTGERAGRRLALGGQPSQWRLAAGPARRRPFLLRPLLPGRGAVPRPDPWPLTSQRGWPASPPRGHRAGAAGHGPELRGLWLVLRSGTPRRGG